MSEPYALELYHGPECPLWHTVTPGSVTVCEITGETFEIAGEHLEVTGPADIAPPALAVVAVLEEEE